jgi:hypothetical protein
MDSSKLEKNFNNELPFWIRAGNFITWVFGFYDYVELAIFALAGFLLALLYWIFVAPIVLFYEFLSWVFRKK